MISNDEEQPEMISNEEEQRPGLGGIPIIDNLEDLSPSDLEESVKKANELHRRSFPEGGDPRPDVIAASNEAPLSSMILLAKNVTPKKFEDLFLPMKARYFLDDNGDLYIRKVPGQTHGAVHAGTTGMIWSWLTTNGFSENVTVFDAANQDFGGKKFEPDVAIHTENNEGAVVSRCIIEIEVANRSPVQARRLAEVYFQDPLVTVVVLLKIWGRRQGGAFAAIGVVWAKTEEGVVCQAAYDFGTAELHALARNSLSGTDDVPPFRQPYVPNGMQWITPLPGRQIDGRDEQFVEIPANYIIRHGPGAILPPIRAIRLDLSYFVRKIENYLPPHGVDLPIDAA